MQSIHKRPSFQKTPSTPPKKTSTPPTESFKDFLLAGAFGGICCSLTVFFNSTATGAAFLEIFLIAASLGAIGGLIPELVRVYVKKDIPLVRSWTMVVILIFLPFFFSSVLRTRLYIFFFSYGYLFSLLSLARRNNLKDF